jgi:maltose O-acetyltransferase
MIKVFGWLYVRLTHSYWQLVYKLIRHKYAISPAFKFNGKAIEFYGEGKIVAGAGSYIGGYSTINAHVDCKVIIGENCMISHNVRIYTSSIVADQDMSILPHLEKNGDVIIGDHVWIGANVFINPGVTIGSNSVVGANSVVTKSVSEFEIVGGVPAKLIRIKKAANES